MSADAPRRLGRGLEALISTAKSQREHRADEPRTRSQGEVTSVRISDVAPNHFQPRRAFNEAELAELEASLRASGLLQPITVRAQSGGGWELVAGERRLRAATRLGWTEIPALVRDFDDRAMLTLALVENLQRADLNALEEAEGYQRLLDEFELTQQQVADAVGKDRSTITNLLRVLTLPVAVRRMLEHGQITTGHARALLAIKDAKRQQHVAQEIVAHQLSVRDVEAKARALVDTAGSGTTGKLKKGIQGGAKGDPEVRRVEERLRRRLQTDVSVLTSGKGKGELRISFYSDDDLERVLEIVLGKSLTDFD